MKRCIVSLATKHSLYVDGLARLSNSLRDNGNEIDFIGFIHEHSVGAPLHVNHPYAFKIYAIQKMIEAGYEQILWLDVSVWTVSPVQPIFNIVTENGYFFEGDGCILGTWCNDKTLQYFNLDRNVAMELPMIQSGFMGFDMCSVTGRKCWLSFKNAFSKGLFVGKWTNTEKTESQDERCLGHRHDQSVISCVLHDLQISFNPVAEYVQYGGIYDRIINDKIIFKCKGL